MKIPAGLIRRLRQVTRVVVLTGAGVSAESGVPTFRDAQTGLWSKYTPEELATPRAFLRNPRLVWEWYAWRRQLVADALPNPAHKALAVMQYRFAEFQLITQNVDGLHQRAGSENVIELHGNIHRTKCFQEGTPVETWAHSEEVPPKCPRCAGPLRPDVVWFEEALPEEAITQASNASQNSEAFLCIGTSSVVYPAAALPIQALKAGATVIEINPQPTPLTERAHFVLPGAAGETLPLLLECLAG
ncbi:MAG: NAD-dependent deacylase [Verrucomicrobiales bacterium]|nr:NAD-dependent deacylase [Verrucomicrobiales bacterium]